MNASNEKRGPEEYDLVILGSGEGSKYLAWTLAGKGERVAVIERKYIGGSCPNIACLPSKNIIHSAKVASYFRRSEEFGIDRQDFTIDAEPAFSEPGHFRAAGADHRGDGRARRETLKRTAHFRFVELRDVRNQGSARR